MSDDPSELDYPYLAQNALRGVVRDVLSITEALGQTPGEHHFYIEFLTGAPGVVISPGLKEQYPERMTIVLQHQFEDLTVSDSEFQVTLYFNEVADHLVIPYDAISQFADPSVNFVLQFPVDMIETAVDEDEFDSPDLPADVETLRPKGAKSPAKKAEPSDDDEPDPSSPEGSADVVSLDRFRKK
ncbi:MAG: SspB family protein [Parvularcula sp.]